MEDPDPPSDDSPDSPEARPTIELNARAGREHAPFVLEKLDACHAALTDAGEHPPAHVSVALVGDKVMCDLHARFSGDPTPTDVLTFELAHGDDARVSDGEVVVCVPQAKRTSKERGTALASELLLYALHGPLHLVGYDDKDAAAFEAMHRREDELLEQVGVGPVFAVGGAA